MSNLSDIKYFLTIAKTLNVTRAAELSGISQPALSHAIKRLESELGTALLLRSKSGVQLTRAGDRFVSQGKALVENWEAVSKSVKGGDQLVGGDFTLGCHPTVAIYALPCFLPALLAQYPDLNFSLSHGLSREITNDVIHWRTDFGLVINPSKHPDLVIRNLGKDEIGLWTNDRQNTPNVLIYDPNLFQTKNLLRQLEKKQIRFDRKIESPNLEVVHALTKAGCGVGILPSRLVKADQANTLRPISKEAPVFQDQLALIYRLGTQSHASGRAIIEKILSSKI